jgi:hypothetical protein
MFIKTLDEISEKQFQDNTKCPPKKKYIFLPKAPPLVEPVVPKLEAQDEHLSHLEKNQHWAILDFYEKHVLLFLQKC